MAVIVPDHLMRSAYLSQNGEAAWSRDEAIAVIDWATTASIGVFGVEVWLPTTPGPTIPTPIFYAHDTEENLHEDWQHFVERANSAARNYVSTFCWDEADNTHQNEIPYFNLTLGET